VLCEIKTVTQLGLRNNSAVGRTRQDDLLRTTSKLVTGGELQYRALYLRDVAFGCGHATYGGVQRKVLSHCQIFVQALLLQTHKGLSGETTLVPNTIRCVQECNIVMEVSRSDSPILFNP
jgi:hypothetical protein